MPCFSSLDDFCLAPLPTQLAYIAAMSRARAAQMHIDYMKHPMAPGLPYEVLEAIVAQKNPDEYVGAGQEQKVRRGVTEGALKRVRAARYKNRVRPLLLMEADEQRAYIANLNDDQREQLAAMLYDYGRECGRSKRVRAAEETLQEMRR
jgi:hypothetical protein